MNRAMIWMASGLLTISTFLGALAQEPGPQAKPASAQMRRGRIRRPEPRAASRRRRRRRPRRRGRRAAKEAADEEPVVTHHHIRLGGEELKYTATAGLMPIKDSKGEAEARIFFMAYTRDDAGPVESAAAVQLQRRAGLVVGLAAHGDARAEARRHARRTHDPGAAIQAGGQRRDLARPRRPRLHRPGRHGVLARGEARAQCRFHSLRGDIESVGEFIRMYLTRYDRWSSPLYVIGESYGTTRAAGLSGHLLDKGIAFNGVILVSCALDFQGIFFSANNDLPYLNYLPSYAASAWYHKKLPADLQQLGLPALLKEVEGWVDREYVTILSRGDRLSDDERRQAAQRLARYTGLKADDIDEHDLRIAMDHFNRELLRPEHRSIGRFDARYKGIENRTPTDSRGPSHDPSYDAVLAPYTSAFYRYIRDELGYKSDMPYHILGGGVGRWDFQTEMGYPSTTSQLRDALTQNPHMQVLIASGYYDLATPYRAVEHALAGLGLDPVLRKNLATEYYEAGHMMYLHRPVDAQAEARRRGVHRAGVEEMIQWRRRRGLSSRSGVVDDAVPVPRHGPVPGGPRHLPGFPSCPGGRDPRRAEFHLCRRSTMPPSSRGPS